MRRGRLGGRHRAASSGAAAGARSKRRARRGRAHHRDGGGRGGGRGAPRGRSSRGSRRALELTGPLPLRRRADGFETLFSAIVSQQVSTAAAAAIWDRLAAIGATEPAGLLAASDEALRAAGLSRQKIAYGRAIAGGGLDFAALRALPDAEVVAELTRIKGIGVWTAEIYAMFSLGRADVFAPGDLALQDAARRLFELEARPGEKALRADEPRLVAVAGGGGAAALGLLPRRRRGREGVR